MTKVDRAAAKRMRRALRVGASSYTRNNGMGQSVRAATPTRRPRLGDLVASGSASWPLTLARLAAGRAAASRIRRTEAR